MEWPAETSDAAVAAFAFAKTGMEQNPGARRNFQPHPGEVGAVFCYRPLAH